MARHEQVLRYVAMLKRIYTSNRALAMSGGLMDAVCEIDEWLHDLSESERALREDLAKIDAVEAMRRG